MAKLTRTQKFAELRESLANDKESSLMTKDLSGYQDKLDSFVEQSNPVEVPAIEEEVKVEEEIVEEDPKYTWTEFDATPIEELVNSFKNEELDTHINEIRNEADIWNSIQEIHEPVKEVSIASENNEAQFEETSDPMDNTIISFYNNEAVNEEVKEEVKETVNDIAEFLQEAYTEEEMPYIPDTSPEVEEAYRQAEELAEPVIEETIEETPVEIEPEIPFVPETSPEVEEAYKQAEETVSYEEEYNEPVEFESIENNYEESAEEVPYVSENIEEQNNSAESIDNYFEEPAAETPVTQEVYEETAVEIPEEPADNHAIDHEIDIINSYFNDTFDEVSNYNKMNGEQTIGTIANNMVNEIRHHEEVQEPEIKEEPVVEEYSEVTEENNIDDDEFSNTVSMEISKIMDEIAAEEIAAPVEEEVVEEHPVLTQTLEAEEEDNTVVEIKNLNELEAETVPQQTTTTIPFVVASDEDEEIEDDDEDSNTILNIILIVLIIILVIVLGLIVFYILKTKGII